jgi:hypothetical protein
VISNRVTAVCEPEAESARQAASFGLFPAQQADGPGPGRATTDVAEAVITQDGE